MPIPPQHNWETHWESLHEKIPGVNGGKLHIQLYEEPYERLYKQTKDIALSSLENHLVSYKNIMDALINCSKEYSNSIETTLKIMADQFENLKHPLEHEMALNTVIEHLDTKLNNNQSQVNVAQDNFYFLNKQLFDSTMGAVNALLIKSDRTAAPNLLFIQF